MNNFNVMPKCPNDVNSNFKFDYGLMKSKKSSLNSKEGYSCDTTTEQLNIFDIAKYILSKTGQISTMKLQKLCYYSQAWSLVWDEAPLFKEDFQAWANGPVCPELFQVHKGKFLIEQNDINDVFCSGKKISKSQKESVDIVLETYGEKSSIWLRDLTHLESPWINARKDCLEGERCSNIITKDSMGCYYGEK